jgi:hypothetical protein
MFDQLSAEILGSLIKGFPRTTTRTTTTTTTTKQNVDPAVYSRVKTGEIKISGKIAQFALDQAELFGRPSPRTSLKSESENFGL